MKKIQRILVATDFSLRADRAVNRAADLAAGHAAELYLLHVLPLLPFQAFKRLLVDTPLETEQKLYNQAEAVLQKKAAILTRNGIDVKYHVAIGRAHVEINRYAKSHQADLIVIGDQGETFVQEFLLGTTASKTLRKGDHPLLIIKQEPKHPYHRILVPVDFSHPSRLALQMALKLVPVGMSATKTSVYVLHVVEPLDGRMPQDDSSAETVELYRSRMLAQARHDMEKIIGDCASGDPRVTSVIEVGFPPAVIRGTAKSLETDLIVIGKRGETELDEALFGSVTKHVLYETPSDILVVNPEI